ncbi:hypothetical protein FDT66_02235 [Polaribacter aestuariivivens]|uniref:Uncharacterized protein n=1 Tax=Polaribacter aestuariivivens TaxID=2304626 RepID=A0A5S3NAR4_9FLAO|nr:hypothetical protein [Polaribacter aestuariivivens]TMM32305.1 hypothetical protein FDT66_02235 [Polaribacter aestuariivivens]
MKNNLLLFIIGFVTYSSFGQVKEIFLNDDLVNITESEFKKITKEPTIQKHNHKTPKITSLK